MLLEGPIHRTNREVKGMVLSESGRKIANITRVHTPGGLTMKPSEGEDTV